MSLRERGQSAPLPVFVVWFWHLGVTGRRVGAGVDYIDLKQARLAVGRRCDHANPCRQRRPPRPTPAPRVLPEHVIPTRRTRHHDVPLLRA